MKQTEEIIKDSVNPPSNVEC